MPLQAVHAMLRFAALVCGENKFAAADIVYYITLQIKVWGAPAGGSRHAPLRFA